jgi:hypothetical protein
VQRNRPRHANGYGSTPSNTATVPVPAGICAVSIGTHQISGLVTDAAGAPLAGALLALSGAASAFTASGAPGTYAFAGLADGHYMVTPSFASDTFSPLSAAVQLAGHDAVAPTFVGRPAPPPAAQIFIAGSTSGVAGEALIYTASAIDCAADPAGWSWNAPGVRFAGAEQEGTVTLSWDTAGSDSVATSNRACGGAGASVRVEIAGAGTLDFKDVDPLPIAVVLQQLDLEPFEVGRGEPP